MKKRGRLWSGNGATQLGFLDVVTALILLGLLVWAAYMQFPAYRQVSPAGNGVATQPPSP